MNTISRQWTIRARRWTAAVAALLLIGGVVACGDDPTDPGGGNGGSEAPATPTGLTVDEADGVVKISWGSVADAETYTLERDVIGAAEGFRVLTDDLGATEYTDADVEVGNTYQYRVSAVNAEGASDPTDPVDVTVGLRRAELRGSIEGVRELSADTTYLLQGIVSVEEGGELRIPAGTLVLGDIETTPTALIVRRGGKLYAEGTADAPVVFTSSAPEGERRRGDWGGVVLNGRSICNFPAGECIGEGNSGPYGGDRLDDDSGRIVYTRIEYVGYEVSFGSELNALTLNGVGSGTDIHHVQTHYGLDDGVEWFGGTVDAKYLLATGISDDSFDFSTGWHGRGQFWIAQQDPDDADNGYEVDGNEDDFDATPWTNPRVYNVTLVGKGPGGSGGSSGESTRGLLLRRGTAGTYANHIVTGFGSAGVDLDNAETVARIDADSLAVSHSIFHDNAREFEEDDDGIDEEALVMRAEWENRIVDPALAAPFDRDVPDFRPTAGSPALDGFATPPEDGFFEPVDFIGGVSPDGTPWYEGWTTTARN